MLLVACGTPPPPPVGSDAGEGVDVTTDGRFDFGDGGGGSPDASPPWPSCTATAQPPLLATCQITPNAIAVDDDNVYWTDFGHYTSGGEDLPGLVPAGDGAVMKCAKTGCGGTPTVLVANLVPGARIPTSEVIATAELTLMSGNLYFESTKQAYWIDSCATGGCNGSPSLTFGAKALIFGLTSDAVNLYWTEETGGGMSTYTCVAASCNAAMSIWTAPPLLDVADIAVDEANVYWAITDNGSTDAGIRGLVMTCPKVGCTEPTIVAVTGALGAQTLAVDDTHVYFGGAGGIASCPKTGCSSPTPIAAQLVTQITSDGTTLYWTAINGSTTSIDSCPTVGCTGSPTVVTTQGGPFAIDATTIYWLSDLGEDAPPCGSVHSKPR